MEALEVVRGNGDLDTRGKGMNGSWCFDYRSPVGLLRAAGSGDALHSLLFAGSGARLQSGADPLDLRVRLDQYFEEGVDTFVEVNVVARGTAFQNLVWKALRAIPYGETRSYGEIASALGMPKASRAVGHANSLNPVAIIVPCHRVIGTSGKLTGYAGGLDRKRWLLDHERGAGAPLLQLLAPKQYNASRVRT